MKSQQVPLADVISGQKKTDLLEVLSKAQNRRHEQVARVWSVFKHIIGKRGPRD